MMCDLYSGALTVYDVECVLCASRTRSRKCLRNAPTMRHIS